MTRLIDADKAERDIEELRKSDWFNAPYLSKERKIGLSEAFDMIQSVCIKHAPPVDAIPVTWLYDLADKKEEEKDIKLSAMIKGVVALWHMEKRKKNDTLN